MWPSQQQPQAQAWVYEDARSRRGYVQQPDPRRQPAMPPPGSFQAGWTPAPPRDEYAPRDLVARQYDQPMQSNYSHQYSSPQPMQYAYPGPPHSASIHTKTQPSTYFHPYQQKNRPLLFVNTIPPPPAPVVGPIVTEVAAPTKPKRKRITPEQLQALTTLFEETDSPSFDVRERMGTQLDMSNREVQVWFQNRRAKVNRIKTQSLAASVEAERAAAKMDEEEVATPVKASPNTMKDQISAFKIVNPAPRSSIPSAPHLQPPPPSQLGQRRQRPLSLQLSDIPERTENFVLDSRSQERSSSVPLSSPFLRSNPMSPAFSPAFSHTTFGTSSPALSTSGSSWISSGDYMTPPTPASLASPTNNFFRLSLDSPPVSSSPWTDSGRFPPMDGSQPPPSPQIRLPPIILPPPWERRAVPDQVREKERERSHQRTSSDPDGTKLPSFRSLAESVDTPGGSPPTQSPRIPSPNLSSTVRPIQQRQRPSSLSNILPTTAEEGPFGSPRNRYGFEPQALGLGMLPIGGQEIDEKERKYSATRKMSRDA